jgi:hypothetical protein
LIGKGSSGKSWQFVISIIAGQGIELDVLPRRIFQEASARNLTVCVSVSYDKALFLGRTAAESTLEVRLSGLAFPARREKASRTFARSDRPAYLGRAEWAR